MGLGQLRRTGKTHWDYSVPMQHADGKELLQSAFVTTPDQDAEAVCRVFVSDTL
jgi:hypothetical protein